jgi:RluA family pseudouridine synthase
VGRTFRITRDDHGRRLDRVLRGLFPDVPLGALMRAVRKGLVRVEGKKTVCSAHVEEGQEILVPWEPASPEKKERTGETGFSAVRSGKRVAIPVLYADEHVLVANKPAGILSQPSEAGGDCIAEELLRNGQTSSLAVPVHRLDRNTSGVLLLSLSRSASRVLHDAWRSGGVEKIYWVLVEGTLPEYGKIDLPLRKDGATNSVAVDDQGSDALTEFERIACVEGMSLARIRLLTGRSHQIRVHLAHIGHPVVGDGKYGSTTYRPFSPAARRPLLHARALFLPVLVPPLEHLSERTFVAPLPHDFRKALSGVAWQVYLEGV